MDLIFSAIGLATGSCVLLMLYRASRQLPLGPISLPGFLAITTLLYFYFMPAVVHERDEAEMFGWLLESLEPIHLASALYLVGAVAAFQLFRHTLRVDPAMPKRNERSLCWPWFWILLGLAAAGIVAQVAIGNLNLMHRENFQAESVEGGAFLNLAFSILIPLTLVALIHRNFDLLSLAFLALVLFIFLTVGFRFRIVILLAGTASAFALTRRRKITLLHGITGVALGLLLVNAIGVMRVYFGGLQFSSLENVKFLELFTHFSGEVGPVFALSHILTDPPPELILWDPWTVALARLVPSILWPDKPFPEYLVLYQAGFPDPAAMEAGIAAPQHAEIFLQFGWLGLPLLAFLYFSIACYTIRAFHRLGMAGRLAGCCLVPAMFGFYMVQRGYFFQMLCEYMFSLAPLFLLYLRKASDPHLAGRRGALPSLERVSPRL